MIDPRAFRRFVEAEIVNEFGRPVRVLPWWMKVAAGLRDRLGVAVKTIRQQGKSLLAGCIAIYLLFHLRGVYILLVAASEAQAKAIALQKFKRPIEANPRLKRDARVLENRIEVPALGNVLEIVPASEATSPGRTVNLLILDEAREIADELYLRLRPSTLACEGRTLITSTPGPPRGFFYELVSNPGPETFVYDAGAQVINPFTSERHLRQAAEHAHLFPGLYDREYRGVFADLGDSFVTRAKLDQVVDAALENRAGSEQPTYGFLDLSRKRDLTSLVLVEWRRQPDESKVLVVTLIESWDPRKFPGGELDFGVVKARLAEVFERFQVRRLGVDDRAEAGEFLQWCARQGWGGRIVPLAATADSNMRMWGALAERIGNGAIRLPRHRRLLDELLSLRVEDMAGGRAWRVVDTRRKLHRDVSMALAGAVWIATENRSTGQSVGYGLLARAVTALPVGGKINIDAECEQDEREDLGVAFAGFEDGDTGTDWLNRTF